MEDLGLLAVLGLLLVKEAGLPIPIPGDLLVLGAGVAAARGAVDPIPALGLLIAATLVGGIIQFGALRGRARGLLLGVLRRVGVSEARIEQGAAPLRARGAVGVAVARMTPGIRIVAIPAAAVAAVAPASFVAGLATGNAVFVGGHFALGLGVGAPAVALLGSVGPAVIAVVAGLAVVGALGWLVIGRRRRRAGPGRGLALSGVGPERAGDWADAACPACLTLAAIGGLPRHKS